MIPKSLFAADEGGVSARSQSIVCVAVTPDSNRGLPLWFTALLLRVLEAFECYISLVSARPA